MKTNTSLSLFNKYKDRFIKHTIDNVFWDSKNSVNLSKGYDKINEVIIFIPKNKNDINDYVKEKEYHAQGKWTLKEGDIIVKGNVEENEVLKLSELSSKYNDVFTIMSVIDRDFGSSNMQHFEIRGN